MRKLLILFYTLTMCFPLKSNEDAVAHYLNNIKVGDAIEYRNLRIFPIIANITMSMQRYITLDEAVDKGWLKIKEVGEGQINFVEVKNKGNKMVFIMTGEMISGAKQDRMIKEDVLLPPKSKWIRVPVYCVEHGRWVQVAPEFKSSRLLVPNALRQRAKISESQAEVWEEIAESQDVLGIASGTGTVKANYEDGKVQKEIDEYAVQLKTVPKLTKSTIGVVVTTGNRIICVDIFANNGLLNTLWAKLIKSYAMDALSGGKGTISRGAIEEFIDTFKSARYVSTGTPGLGQLIKIESDFGKGSVLVYKTAVVHLDFFPTEGMIDESGLRLDFRRGQRLDN